MQKQIIVDKQVSLIGPDLPMLGPIKSGDTVVLRTAPGCWGPMITPEIIGGHEVTQPIAIEGAEPGDAVAIKIKDIRILALGAMSGSDKPISGRFQQDGDAATFAQCPSCGTFRPKTTIEGIGADCIRCRKCGAPMNPFEITFGYTVVFDHERRFAVTVDKANAEQVARQAYQYAALPAESIQNPATLMAVSDLTGVWSRLRPFAGNLGLLPAMRYPSVKNSRDIAAQAIGAKNEFGINEEDLDKFSDCHLDCADVRAGAIFIVPVRISGGGLYMGDVHAVQGSGEIAGHTIDVAAEATLEIELLKNVNFNSSLLLPNLSDLSEMCRPLSAKERELLGSMASRLDIPVDLDALPFQVIGTGTGLNESLICALQRMSTLTGLSYDEVRNRCTIAGDAKMARSNGVMQLTMLTPIKILKQMGIYHLVKKMYSE